MPSLEELLTALDRTAANLAKLDAILKLATPHFPCGPSAGSSREYDNLRRNWSEILSELPPIDGCRLAEQLPDIDEVGRNFIDYADIGEPPFGAWEQIEAPGRALDDYRFRLGKARRTAVRGRIEMLVSQVNSALARVVVAVQHRDVGEFYADDDTATVDEAFRELDRLIGDGPARSGRWSDMARHLSFSQTHDWRDIAALDWPDIRERLDVVGSAEFDPIAVGDIDLGQAAASQPSGGVSSGIGWDRLDAEGFERMLFDLLRGLAGYENVQWLMKTNAPDRGRDLSVDRHIFDSAGPVKVDRTIVQAKRWLSTSVRPSDVQDALATLSLWEPPVIRSLVIATSGRFTADAIGVIEKHNSDGKVPLIEMWANSQLETLLAKRPDIVEAHGLRAH